MIFKTIFPQTARYPRITDDECDALIARISIDDARGDAQNVAEAKFWQFWAHWTFNTTEVGGVRRNLYFGDMTGHFGAYPPARMNSALLKDGYFLLHQGSLPSLRSDDEALREVTPDEHRNNENRVLAAWHLALARLHNARMDKHGDFDRAFDEVVAAFNKAALKAACKMLDMTPSECLTVKVADAHMAAEGAFGYLRFGHPMMPETFAGHPLFDKTIRAADVPMLDLLEEDAGRIGLRMSPPMVRGSEGGKGKSILEHSIKIRHNQQNLACWADVARRYGGRQFENPSCPVFYGMLDEAEDGRFGPVGRRLVADGIAATLLWGRDAQKGIYYNEPGDLPCSVEDILREVWA